MRDQFRCMLKIGKIESWSGFELFQPYFFFPFCVVGQNRRKALQTRDFAE